MNRHKHGHIGWVDLMATNMESQSEFYESLFGWEHNDIPTIPGAPPYRMFTLEGNNVAAASPKSPDMPESMPSMWNTYVSVDDADAIVARATQRGGQIVMPLMQVMTSGRMVAIADPSGAPLFFWEPQDHPGADVFGEPGSLLWSDLNTRDLETAADYYEGLLGWDIDRSGDNDPNYWSFTIDGEAEGGMMLMTEEFPPELPPHWLVYFAVDDAREIAERAEELGGRAETEPMEIPVCIFSVLSDPEGAAFAVMQMKPR